MRCVCWSEESHTLNYTDTNSTTVRVCANRYKLEYCTCVCKQMRCVCLWSEAKGTVFSTLTPIGGIQKLTGGCLDLVVDALHSTAQHSTAQHSTAQHSTAQHSTAQHNTTQHSTTQHNTAQHNTAQHSTTNSTQIYIYIIYNKYIVKSHAELQYNSFFIGRKRIQQAIFDNLHTS